MTDSATIARTPDQEVERLLLRLVPDSPFRGRVYAVGGYVRDAQLGIASKDLDLVVEQPGGARALTTWLHAKLGAAVTRPHELGAGYPIWQIVFQSEVNHGGETYLTKDATIEVADTQFEMFPDPESRQRVTRYGDLAEDCRRRDFTVNMLYRDLTTGNIVDPCGRGLGDLHAGVLRGHPEVDLHKIFSDDPLRMIRLVRFHVRFGWTIPTDVLRVVSDCAERVKILSAERVRDEFTKIMLMGRLGPALELLRATGLLPELFPELLPMIGCGQDRHYHSEGDVWVHTLRVIQNTPPTLVLQLAALLHDVGKPATRSEHGDRVKFLGHEKISTEIARHFMQRWKFESGLIARVEHLVALHLRGGDATAWTSLKPARKLIRDAGDALPDLLKLIEADSRSSLGPDGNPRLEHLPVLHDRLARAGEIPVQRRPVLNGHEVMQLLQLPAGPEIRSILDELREWEDDEAIAGRVLTREAAEARLRTRRRD
ncbi:MAG: HD domain-containing protein [Bdellovibrionales bacterium]|nr:HD domain-containing protein [Bdellovibrionales bacterium]